MTGSHREGKLEKKSCARHKPTPVTPLKECLLISVWWWQAEATGACSQSCLPMKAFPKEHISSSLSSSFIEDDNQEVVSPI